MKFGVAIAVALLAVGAGVGAAEPRAAGSTPPASRAASGSAASSQPSPALMAWIDVCVKNLSSSDEGVRAGAAAALRQAGNAAAPALEKLAAGTGETASTAKRVLGQIQRASTPARAAAGEPARHGPSVDEMTAKLGLAGDQAAKFKSIMEQFHAKQAELSHSVQSGDVAVNDAGGKAALLREKTDAELAKLLTPEQMKTYLQMLPSPSAKRASASATR